MQRPIWVLKNQIIIRHTTAANINETIHLTASLLIFSKAAEITVNISSFPMRDTFTAFFITARLTV